MCFNFVYLLAFWIRIRVAGIFSGTKGDLTNWLRCGGCFLGATQVWQRGLTRLLFGWWWGWGCPGWSRGWCAPHIWDDGAGVVQQPAGQRIKPPPPPSGATSPFFLSGEPTATMPDFARFCALRSFSISFSFSFCFLLFRSPISPMTTVATVRRQPR